MPLHLASAQCALEQKTFLNLSDFGRTMGAHLTHAGRRARGANPRGGALMLMYHTGHRSTAILVSVTCLFLAGVAAAGGAPSWLDGFDARRDILLNQYATGGSADLYNDLARLALGMAVTIRLTVPQRFPPTPFKSSATATNSTSIGRPRHEIRFSRPCPPPPPPHCASPSPRSL